MVVARMTGVRLRSAFQCTVRNLGIILEAVGSHRGNAVLLGLH